MSYAYNPGGPGQQPYPPNSGQPIGWGAPYPPASNTPNYYPPPAYGNGPSYPQAQQQNYAPPPAYPPPYQQAVQGPPGGYPGQPHPPPMMQAHGSHAQPMAPSQADIQKKEKNKKTKKKIIKYGVPIAGVAVGAYALKKIF